MLSCHGPPSATSFAAALVYFADHNITPPLDEQLILELEGGELCAKIFKQLPCGLCFRKACPLDEDMPIATMKLSPQSTLRLLEATTMV